MPFCFKYFNVEDDKSTMRVGTDAMLLGAFIAPPDISEILEIGTGCGVISLMMAQKSFGVITAIDIHEPSIKQADGNFKRSQWNERLKVMNIPFKEFAEQCRTNFDLIITNPPFFRTSLLPLKQSKIISKHDKSLTLEDIIDGTIRILSPEGILALILPITESKIFEHLALQQGLYLKGNLLIYSKSTDETPVRIISEFTQQLSVSSEEKLFIRNPDCSYSAKYLKITENFHMFDN